MVHVLVMWHVNPKTMNHAARVAFIHMSLPSHSMLWDSERAPPPHAFHQIPGLSFLSTGFSPESTTAAKPSSPPQY